MQHVDDNIDGCLNDLGKGLRNSGEVDILPQGDVQFSEVKRILDDAKFEGWCTVEQDCDPTLDVSPIADAIANRNLLKSIGF